MNGVVWCVSEDANMSEYTWIDSLSLAPQILHSLLVSPIGSEFFVTNTVFKRFSAHVIICGNHFRPRIYSESYAKLYLHKLIQYALWRALKCERMWKTKYEKTNSVVGDARK